MGTSWSSTHSITPVSPRPPIVAQNSPRLDRGFSLDFLTRVAHRGPESAKLVLRSTSYADSRGTPMLTQCSPTEMEFGRAGGRRVVADFDGGLVSSDAGALLLGETD